jgi:hypothetical protein
MFDVTNVYKCEFTNVGSFWGLSSWCLFLQSGDESLWDGSLGQSMEYNLSTVR